MQIISVSINQYWSPSCDMTMSEMIQSGAYISSFIINFRQSQTWKNQRQRQPNRQDLSSQRLHRNPGAFFCFVFFLVTCTRLYNPFCRSVGRSVGPSVCRSVGNTLLFWRLWAVLKLLLLPNSLVGLFLHCPCPPTPCVTVWPCFG